MNSTDEFVGYLHELSRAEVSQAWAEMARLRLLDYLGVTLAGSAILSEKGRHLLALYSSDPLISSVIGFGRKAAPQTAAILNAMSAHTTELDDGERFGMIHPGAPVISAVLAAVEDGKLTAPDLFRGMIVGYEAAIRLAGALQPGMKDRGFHATGICGTIGAAMGVAASLSFSRDQMKNAFTAAATGASGLLQVIRGGSELKPYNAGQAAMNGLMATSMARAGFQGPSDVLEGEQGFLRVMGGDGETPRRPPNPSDPLGMQRVYVKPYAACRHCHAPIEAALTLRAKHRICPDTVRGIKVLTHRWAVHLHDHRTIEGTSSAKMSVPYSVAAALNTGKAGLNEFSEDQIRNPTTLRLTQMVQVEADEDLTALVPHTRPALVEITTSDGQHLRERVDLPKGEPENPLSPHELRDKFVGLATYAGWSDNQAKQMLETVSNLNGSLDPLFAYFQEP